MEDLNTTNSKAGDYLRPSLYLSSVEDDELQSIAIANGFVLTQNKSEANISISSYVDLIIEYKSNIYPEQMTGKIKRQNFTYLLQSSLTYFNQQNLLLVNRVDLINNSSSDKTDLFKSTFLSMSQLADNSAELTKFCQSFFNFSFFSSFMSLQLFLHKKGETRVTTNYITPQEIVSSTQEAKDFTRLYSAIKKSKNGSFGHASLKSYNFDILGTCLAKEFSIKEYNFIFILSRNDFLSQTAEDIKKFRHICHFLPYFFNNYLKNENTTKLIRANNKIIHSVIRDNHVTPNVLNHQDIEDFILNIKENHFSSFDVNHKERVDLLGELLNTLRHELSNPLFGLQLSAELIETDGLDSDSVEFVDEIKLAINRCQSIISNFSDLYLDKSTVSDINLVRLINEVITLTKSRSKHIQKNVFLNDKRIDSQTNLSISTNKTLLAHVLFNLIINSTQALDNGPPPSKVPMINILIETTRKGITRIFIKDNGPGLKENISRKIFNPFFTTKDTGTGLGLSICKNLLQKINGEIRNIKSDNGACFLIELPNEYTHR